MRKNTASQTVCAQLNSTTNGSAVTTGTTTVYVLGDGGTQGTGGGTVAHEGQGCWSYVPTQAETNYTHVAYTFVNTSAISQTINVYPEEYNATTGRREVDVFGVSGDSTAADNLELDYDGTGYAKTNSTIGTATEVTNQRAKYSMGAVWIGPTANTNTTNYVDGTIDNPVSTIAAAKTIADSLGLKRFFTVRTGATQITASMVGYSFVGDSWSLTTTGAVNVSDSSFVNATLTGGSFASTTLPVWWENCEFPVAVTAEEGNWYRCTFGNTLTLGAAGDYDFVDCASIVAGAGSPTFTMPAGTVNVSFRRWSGGITVSGITSGSTVSIDCVSGGTVPLNGADGNVQVRGMVKVVDNRTGSPTLGTTQVINDDTINAAADLALTDYDPPTKAEMDTGFAALNDFDPAVDTVANVTTVATVTNDVGVNEWNGVALATTNPLPNAAAGAAGGLPTDSTGKTSFNDITTAQVNAEVVDALVTDTYAEPGQGTPAATTSLKDKIGYIYKFLRNRKTATSSQLSVYNDDATTVDHKSAISDNGTTYDEGEWSTGP
jgi:hypothetical protein